MDRNWNTKDESSILIRNPQDIVTRIVAIPLIAILPMLLFFFPLCVTNLLIYFIWAGSILVRFYNITGKQFSSIILPTRVGPSRQRDESSSHVLFTTAENLRQPLVSISWDTLKQSRSVDSNGQCSGHLVVIAKTRTREIRKSFND